MPFPFYNQNQRTQIRYYSKSDPKVIEGKLIQNTIGLIAIVWPMVLIVGQWILEENKTIEPSISAYYHTGMGHIFTGGLFVIGASMLAYRGFHCVDGRMGNIAGALAITVALFPVDKVAGGGSVWNSIHYIAALLLFLALAYFCIVIFTLSTDEEANKKYKLCGWAILFFIAGMGIDQLVFKSDSFSLFGKIDLFLVLEILTLWAFGYSWLLKGNIMGALRESNESDTLTPILVKKEKLYKAYNETFPKGPDVLPPSSLVGPGEVETEPCFMPA